MLAVCVLLAMVSASFAAGYLTRDIVSRRRRAEARVWAPYTQPNRLSAPPANRNNKVQPQGELGQMLMRWERRKHAQMKSSPKSSRGD
nr:hypothetical protein [Bradyrhizobium sp. I71]